ncbi:GTP pyrophosphokinase [Clostridium perfringens]|uniref:GTP pyrophosphokinase n=1 Tax=Clostridium perfringens TaxID=1502 RepID=UPI001122E254|nr:hypothetical protein [Clostridium perfringens]EHK2441445.1 hypothetical protein [Clostridium perfringens]TPE20764.1 hypothetical protein FJM09_04930 [Clostridium perfringens]
MNKKIHEQYLKEKDTYKILGKKMKILIKELLDMEGINYQSVSCRTKDEKSFLNKLERKEGKYKDLKEITDITGIRIITYYSDTVDEVAKIISEQFEVDNENTIDKRKALDPDRFGYLSLHYIVSLNEDRFDLPEYRMFREIKFEIQIRSISQHTWAEIEHDLGYKSEIGIPGEIKRDFCRLAGLLELVDKEFLEIREKLKDYEKNVEINLETDKEKIFIDNISLKAYIDSNNYILSLNKKISESFNARLEKASKSTIENIVNSLKYLGFETIKDIELEVRKNEEGIYNLAKNILKHSKQEYIGNQIALGYLCYYKLCELGSIDKFNSFFEDNGFKTNEEFAENLISIYKEYKKSEN